MRHRTNHGIYIIALIVSLLLPLLTAGGALNLEGADPSFAGGLKTTIGGHDSVGVTEPSKTWYLAEGSTGEGFETWILVQNPGGTAADVQLTCMTQAGEVTGPRRSIAAGSRVSFNLSDTVPGTWEVSTRVTSDTPVIAERAMYWGTGEQPSGNVLEDVRYFAYQIQGQSWDGNIQKLIDSHYDLLVIDQTRSVKGEEGYDSKGEVARLKGSGNSTGGNKIVVCYIDVGEAESYRWYWRDGWKVGNPDWIIAPDPDGWDENYPVAFWNEEWKEIMKEAVDGIIEDGYDGVYLDWLEAYSFEPVADAARDEGLDARDELVEFIRELAVHARSRKPGFLFIAQNAAELGSIPGYVGLFDAIAQEAIWYDGGGDPDSGETEGDVPVDPELTDEYLDALALWRQAGKPVFDVEYAEEPANTQRAYRLGEDQGFKSYVTLRPLEALTRTPPPGY